MKTALTDALDAIKGHCGWYVYDNKSGLHSGPYKSAADAYAVIAKTESKAA